MMLLTWSWLAKSVFVRYQPHIIPAVVIIKKKAMKSHAAEIAT